MTAPKILLLDIETAPNVAHVWGLWQQNVGINQIQASSYVMCWAAKWYGDSRMHYERVTYEHGEPRGEGEMLAPIHQMLDEADIVVHYNGRKFDIPTLNKAFLLHGFTPPSPYRQVDLLQTARRQFRFPSNKLEYIARALGIGGKVHHAGHGLWVACMADDPKAWALMGRYNRQDVKLLEKLYVALLPWIQNHPNLAIWGDGLCCTSCGSMKLQKRGQAITAAQTYQRFQCQTCGTWMRGVAPERKPTPIRGLA